jgi:endonuclease/exonuclease/phosphatase family metal-dependent hydrolase
MLTRWRWILMLGAMIGTLGGLVRFAMGSIPSGGTILAANGPTNTAKTLDIGDELTILSWNIHYGGGPTLEVGRGQSRAAVVGHLDAIAAYIRSVDADIVALQEVDRGAIRSYDIDQLRWLQEATGMPFAVWTPTWDAGWVPHPGLNPKTQIGRVLSGQVVLSRFALTTDEHHRLPQPKQSVPLYNRFYLHRHLTQVTAKLGESGDLRIINAHLEAFDSANRQSQADTAVAVVGSDTTRTVLLGDMNSTPPEAKMRAAFPDEPETDMSTDDTIDRLRQISGMREVVPPKVYAADESAWFTFPAHAPNRRLDYVFYGSSLSLMQAEVPRFDSPPSDHLPVVTRFRLE